MDRLMTVINNKVTVEGDNFGQQYILKRTEKRKEIGLIAVAKKRVNYTAVPDTRQ